MVLPLDLIWTCKVAFFFNIKMKEGISPKDSGPITLPAYM